MIIQKYMKHETWVYTIIASASIITLTCFAPHIMHVSNFERALYAFHKSHLETQLNRYYTPIYPPTIGLITN